MPKISKQTVFIFKLLTIALILTGAQTGCNSRKKENLNPKAVADIQTQRSVPLSAETFKIVLAQGGGFTALWHGYSLYSDGRIENWRRFGAQADSILWTIQADQQEIRQFSQELKKSGIMSQEIQRWGNVSQSVSYVTPDTTLVWAWTDDDANQLPIEFRNWHERARKFCARLKNNQP